MLPGIGQPIKSSGRGAISLWTLEWTYTDAAGAVLLDATISDQDARVATPVADGGTGLTLIRFPKSRKAKILHMSLQSAVSGTLEKQVTPGPIDPVAGTFTFVMCTAPSTLADPASGARGRLTLALDYE